MTVNADDSPGTVVRLSADGDDVLVEGAGIVDDRRARVFFSAVLGARREGDAWRCPRRSVSRSAHILRINSYLERAGYRTARVGLVDEEVERDLARRRSFDRTRQAASELRSGQSQYDAVRVLEALRSSGWDMDSRHLRPHQIEAVIHGLTGANVANFSVPGAGKTASTLALASVHRRAETIEIVVVVGPLSCFRPWEQETALAAPNVWRVRRVRGDMSARRAAYASVRAGDVVLVSYATAAADRASLEDLLQSRRAMLVVDESHRVKRFRGGLWAPALMQLARSAAVRVILTGTPMPQSGRDLYSQLNILWPGHELTGPAQPFADAVRSDFGQILGRVLPFVSRTPKEALGLPSYRVERHDVELQGLHREIYQLVESNIRRRLRAADSVTAQLDVLRRGRSIRLLQAATNPDLLLRQDPLLNVGAVADAGSTLLERLSRFRLNGPAAKNGYALGLLRPLMDDGQKCVVWSNFVPNLDAFGALARRELQVPVFQVDGRVPAAEDSEQLVLGVEPETREYRIAEFLDSPSAAVLVANPASCSESISLHRSCRNAVYIDRTYDCAMWLQSIDRIHRLGLPPDAVVTVHVLMAVLDGQPVVDGLVDASLNQKEAAMRRLLEGAQLQPFGLADDPLVEATGDDDDLRALLRYLLGETSRPDAGS